MSLADDIRMVVEYQSKERTWIFVDELESLRKDAARFRWLKVASKEEYLMARGVFGLSDEVIDYAIEGGSIVQSGPLLRMPR